MANTSCSRTTTRPSRQIDAVSFGQQTADISQGRIPDGDANIVFMPGSPTPGTKNVLLPAPSVTTNPTSQTVNSGDSVTLMAAGTGSAPLTYQWRFNGVNIAGATSPTLSLNPVTVGNNGRYTCVLSNTAGSATTNAAQLTVSANFAQWQSYYFTSGELSNPAISGATADPDGDGISNLQEFFHNLNPRQTATGVDRAALPQVGYEPGATTYVTITFRQSLAAVFTSVVLQASTTTPDTAAWTTVTPDVTQNMGNDPVTGDPITKWKVIVTPEPAPEIPPPEDHPVNVSTPLYLLASALFPVRYRMVASLGEKTARRPGADA